MFIFQNGLRKKLHIVCASGLKEKLYIVYYI